MAVAADATGLPRSFSRDSRVVLVASIEDSWRIDEEWWRQQIARRYYLLALEDGQSMTVFQDQITGVWYRQNYS